MRLSVTESAQSNQNIEAEQNKSTLSGFREQKMDSVLFGRDKQAWTGSNQTTGRGRGKRGALGSSKEELI